MMTVKITMTEQEIAAALDDKNAFSRYIRHEIRGFTWDIGWKIYRDYRRQKTFIGKILDLIGYHGAFMFPNRTRLVPRVHPRKWTSNPNSYSS